MVSPTREMQSWKMSSRWHQEFQRMTLRFALSLKCIQKVNAVHVFVNLTTFLFSFVDELMKHSKQKGIMIKQVIRWRWWRLRGFREFYSSSDTKNLYIFILEMPAWSISAWMEDMKECRAVQFLWLSFCLPVSSAKTIYDLFTAPFAYNIIYKLPSVCL